MNLTEIVNGVTEGNVSKAEELTHEALDRQISAKEILDNGLLPAMDRVGGSFERGESFLTELAKKGIPCVGKYAIETVQGDLHESGAPVTQRFTDEIGADAYAKDAVEAVTKARSLLNR